MNLTPAIKALAEAGVPDPGRDARRLFDWAYDRGAAAPEAQDRDHPNDLTLEMFEIAMTQRIARKPVSQIIGSRAFWRHDFVVTRDVLDPRPDTETLVELALTEPFDRVADLGTGSGCILLSLLADRPKAQGVGCDLSEAALKVAGINARALGVADRVKLIVSDWFSALQGRYDLIVSNPPYIGVDEMDALAPEVRDHEPRMALTDEGDGLGCYRILAEGVAQYLTPGGRVLVEIGLTQGGAVSDLFRAAGLQKVCVHQDLNGRDRVVSAVSSK